MKTMILAAAAMLSIGVGAAYAGDGEDGGTLANTYFSEIPGEATVAPGLPPNNVAINAYPTMGQPAATMSAVPAGTTNGG